MSKPLIRITVVPCPKCGKDLQLAGGPDLPRGPGEPEVVILTEMNPDSYCDCELDLADVDAIIKEAEKVLKRPA